MARGATDENNYEQLRALRIAKNKEKLKQLGLSKPKRATVVKSLKKEKEKVPVVVNARRSSRLKHEPMRFSPLELKMTKKNKRNKRVSMKTYVIPQRIVKHKSEFDVKYDELDSERIGAVHLYSGFERKCTELSADFDIIHNRWLGKQILPNSGKFTIMSGMSYGFVPTFSRMLGVQQWKNALVLFVNIDVHDIYKNVFTRSQESNAVTINWFASARSREDSQTIRRLVAADDTIMLFCRKEGMPYVYFGTLGYVTHDPSRCPIPFEFELLDNGALDWDKLKQVFGSHILE